MMNWMTRVALELIGQGGLGYSFDPLVTDSANRKVPSTCRKGSGESLYDTYYKAGPDWKLGTLMWITL